MTLLHVAGPEAFEAYNSFQWASDGDENKVDEIIEMKFERYCNSKKNLTLKDIHSFQGINLMGSRLTRSRLTCVTSQQYVNSVI